MMVSSLMTMKTVITRSVALLIRCRDGGNVGKYKRKRRVSVVWGESKGQHTTGRRIYIETKKVFFLFLSII